jgi:hypothetical protein
MSATSAVDAKADASRGYATRSFGEEKTGSKNRSQTYSRTPRMFGSQ